MKEKIKLKRSIWPDIDGPEDVNRFLKRLGIEVKFLLDDGLEFSYQSDRLEPVKLGEGTLYFRDPITKDLVFHYYEDIGEAVFEDLIMVENFRVPIYEDGFE